MAVAWGEWVMGWRAGLEKDVEQSRIDRQKAAFGAETLAKLKDINVLIVGLRGVGVETAKNLILTNVGGVVVWDPEPTQIRDLGSNFYLTEADAQTGRPRAEACLSQLKSLNPYCKVDTYHGPLSDEFILQSDVNGTGKPFSAVIVTKLLPKSDLFHINEIARQNRIAFILAYTSGVTASLFSDFGPQHVISDLTGEPTETKALSNIEVLAKPPVLKVSGAKDGDKIVVLSCDSNHDLVDGSTIEVDDLHGGGMEALNGTQFTVKHLSFVLYDPNREVKATDLDELLKEGTVSFADYWGRRLEAAEKDFVAGGGDPSKWSSKLREITLLNRLVLVYEHPERFDGYQFGGLINPVKLPVVKNYASLEESLVKTPGCGYLPGFPRMLLGAAGEVGDGIEIHLSYAAALEFQVKHNRWPRLGSDEDADDFLAIAQAISDGRKDVEESIRAQKFNAESWSMEDRELVGARIKRFSRLFGAELTGFCAYLGGAAAQEVVKKTGKFNPIDQWIHHEDAGLVADESKANIGPPMFSRYDDQISILGKDFQSRAANARVFLVGCGALGCEYLKGLSLMGVGVGARGQVIVTDMDTIETSNLSRQFLFRAPDVGSSKSVTGSRVVKGWNPAMNVTGIEKFVGPSTEDYFDDAFWTNLDICWNALDNVKARKYTDGRCLWYSKPLLESGTMGTKTNGEVILPFRTQTYNDGEDPPEVGIAMCTLRSFPFLPLHCIEYVKQALYTENFEFGPAQYENFRKDKAGFFKSLDDMSKDSERVEAMQFVKTFVDLQKSGPIGFEGCLQLSFSQLNRHFREKIIDVVHAGDTVEKSSGKPYWTGTKRKPNPVEFSLENSLAMEFLYITSNMYAFVWGVPFIRDRVKFEAIVRESGLKLPSYSPSGAKIEGEGEEAADSVDPKLKSSLKHELESLDVRGLQPAKPHDFEKDDDDNFHVDYLTAATNLRAWNYNIKQTPRHAVKVIAGRIIPALATTTAMICGLIDIEFCKVIMGLSNLGVEKFMSCNINLALGSEAFNGFNPEPPIRQDTNLDSFPSFTSWDKIELNEDGKSASQVAAALGKAYGAKVISLDGETNYRPAMSIPLWKEDAGNDGKTLSEIFLERMAAGDERADRSPENRKRMRAEIKKLEREIPAGFTFRVKPGDDFVLQFKLTGPSGTPYEGGLFLIEVKIPADYPNVPPALSFLTPIEHCNILDGVPCPNLLFGVWSPALTVQSVLSQLIQLLKEQSKSDALVPSLAAMDDAAFFAHARAATQKNAVPGQEFPEAPVKEKEKKEVLKWPHTYIILKGEFESLDGKEAFLPRIKLHISDKGKSAQGEGKGKEEVAASDELLEKVKGLNLELEGNPLTVIGCYRPTPDRALRYAACAEGLTPENALCVSCQTADGDVVETVVNADTLEHLTFTDPIFYEECFIPSFVEAQFAEGGSWTLARGGSSVIEEQKKILFNMYAKDISEENPTCLSTLRRMLQSGPITRVYTGGGRPPHIASHEGFVLRMPAEEIQEWTMVNDKGDLVDIPRPALHIRIWNAKKREYEPIDPLLDGAPTTPEETDAWFVGVVKKLKASPYLGSELLNRLVTSVRHTDMEQIMSGQYEGAFEGSFLNRWVELVIKTE